MRYTSMTLPRAGLAALFLVTGLTVPARAQHVNQTEAKQLQGACGPELTRYCPGTPVTVQPLTICLHQYYLDLSLICRNALKQQSAAGNGPT